MQFSIRHRTTYRYLQEVAHSHHLLHLEPRATATQSVSEAELQVSPAPARRVRRADAFGNPAEWLSLDEPHSTLEILCESRVATRTTRLPAKAGAEPWELMRAALEKPASEADRDAAQYLFDSPYVWFTADLAAYARASFTPGRPLLQASLDLMARIHKDFRYDTTVTDVSTPVDRVFAIRAGVCQDLAHLMIACIRALGLPARYVSGYLLTEPPPGQVKLLGADASHAWLAVYSPGHGWIDLDPTNNLMPEEGHITLGWGRDYGDVAPINGIVNGGGEHLIEVAVDVIPVAAEAGLPG
jgi:transglutaminase-like putative cysteine protease